MLDSITSYINDRYGSRRGLVNFYKLGLRRRFGMLAQYQEIDWHSVERLVFVCHGNICRSPFAAAVAREIASNSCSLGIDCTPDRGADPRAIAFAELHGYDLHNHRTRRLDSVSLTAADLVVVMEPKHLESVDTVGREYQVTLLGLWHPRPLAYIHDPYSANPAFFNRCQQFVMESTRELCGELVNSSSSVRCG